MQNVAGLQVGAVESKQLVLRHSNLRSRTKGSFLGEQLIQIAKSGRAFLVRARAVTRQFTRESIRPFDDRAGRELGAAEGGLRPAGNGGVVHNRLLMGCVWIGSKGLRRASLDLVHYRRNIRLLDLWLVRKRIACVVRHRSRRLNVLEQFIER